jgi:perosamine synthetase
VLDSGYINDGPTTRELEKRLAEIVGVKYACATPSCTAALTISLMAAGIGPGDEVLVPDITFIATANAVKLAGGSVKLVDVEAGQLTICPEKIIEAIGPTTKAVVTVDFNGRSSNYQAIEKICNDHGLALICDSAEALGSEFKGRRLGSYGIAGCFSFSGHKMFFGGQGGAVVTNNEAFYERLKDLRNHARRDAGPADDTIHVDVGYNFKYPSLVAATVLAQLGEFDIRMSHARTRDTWYRETLQDIPGLSFQGSNPDTGEICLWADARVDDKQRLMLALESASIGFRPFFLPLHRQAPYQAEDDHFPIANDAWEKGLWLPSAVTLVENQVKRTSDICRQALVPVRM